MTGWPRLPQPMLPTCVLATLGAALAGSACARQDSSDHMGHESASTEVAAVARPPFSAKASTPTPTFDAEGRLWVAWVEDENRVMVAGSSDLGQTFAEIVAVTPSPEPIDANGEGRPKIIVSGEDVFVSWTRKGEKPYTGDIRFTRSTDGGRTFEAPKTVNDDRLEIGHRFETLAQGPDGRLYVFWIDKRDLERATADGLEYAGAALYYTFSDDKGRTFAPNRKLKDHICECCRLAVAFDARGLPVVTWRDIFEDSVRDHALLRFASANNPGASVRATFDGWGIEACPHHGPSVALDANGTYHMVWFTGKGPQGPGAFYARSTDEGRTFSKGMRLGSDEAIGHAAVTVVGTKIYVVWKELTPSAGMAIRAMRADAGGTGWSPPWTVAETAGGSDHPLLVTLGPRVFLSWFTTGESYRLIELEPAATTLTPDS